MFSSRTGLHRVLFFSFSIILLIPIYILRYGWSVDHLQVVPGLLNHWGFSGSQPSHLRRRCDQTTWTDGLWIQCHSGGRLDSEGKASIYGGLNNARNRIQSCLRVAIDAGAGVVMPSVATRNETALLELGAGDPVPVSNFWDMDYLTNVLGKQCPQLQVRFNLENIMQRVNAPERHFLDARYRNGTFRKMVVSLLEKSKVSLTAITSENPVAVSFGDTYLSWDYVKSGELSTIRKDLFRLLIYNQTLLDISSTILASPQLKKGFIGIHHRAEGDWPASWGSIADQRRLYIAEMEKIERSSLTDLKVVYVSSGNRTGIQDFREMLEPLGYQVHDKWSLLSENPALLGRVEGLMFDEKAVVEYQMLLNAELFLGLALSTMSALVSYARALDDPENFFPTYIFPGSTKNLGKDGLGLKRYYPEAPIMKGDSKSKLLVVNGKNDIMDFFP